MKRLFLTAVLTMICNNASAYNIQKSISGEYLHWPAGQVDIVIDSSIDDDTAALFESAFLKWSDYIEQEIIFNFVYRDCDTTTVCMLRSDDYCGDSPICATGSEWYRDSGELTRYSIAITSRLRDRNRENAILHEVGHWFGMHHSSNPRAVMYPYISERTELHADDIAGIKTAYSEDGTVYPAPEIDDIEYGFDGCSINNKPASLNIWSLIF